MAELFTGAGAADAVTPAMIEALTGTSADDLGLDTSTEYTALLQDWIDRICSQVHVRLLRQVDTGSSEFLGIVDVVTRTVAKVVAVALQQRTSPVVQLSDYAVSVLNTAQVTESLDEELKPFIAWNDSGGDDGGGSGGPGSLPTVAAYSSLDEWVKPV